MPSSLGLQTKVLRHREVLLLLVHLVEDVLDLLVVGEVDLMLDLTTHHHRTYRQHQPAWHRVERSYSWSQDFTWLRYHETKREKHAPDFSWTRATAVVWTR